MIDRDAVRNTAKYLRNVRPIDPEEITDYVPQQPHPGVIRQVLREEAFELGLLERPDGCFVPLDDGTVPPPGWRPSAFPSVYQQGVTELLVERFDASWYEDESGNRLRNVIDRFKADYFDGNAVTYDDVTALGYAIYHLPDYYAAVGYVLDELTEPGRLPRRLRVLDIGAGTGGPALGLHDYLFGTPPLPGLDEEETAATEGKTGSQTATQQANTVESEKPTRSDSTETPDALVEYHAIEPSANAIVLERLLDATDPNFHTTIHRERIEDVAFSNGGIDDVDGEKTTLDGEWDVLLFGNVLSELSNPRSTLGRSIDALAEDGALIGLAPADLETATGLRDLERSLAKDRSDVTVYAPELRLWPGAQPSDRGWSFDVAPDLAVPEFQRQLDEHATRGPEDEPGRYVNVDVQFSYTILRTDGVRRYPIRANPNRHARMEHSREHVPNRIDLLAVKLSHDLSDGSDSNPLYRIGDGSQTVDHFAVVTRETALNDALQKAPYGSVLRFENGLLLWNDDENAFNLVVDDETTVDRRAA